jgi:hypothetical protein
MRFCSAALLIAILVAGSLAPCASTSPRQVESPPGRDLVRLEPAEPRGKRDNPAIAFVIVRHVRLSPALPIGDLPSAVMRFDVQNRGSREVMDIDVKVVLVAASLDDRAPRSPMVLAGPFTVRTRRALMPGERFDYEIRLRNLTSECDCLAKVDVIGAHFTSEP